ncbi:MAG TPA: ABC transporter permease [Clostridiales bacterium]|nr:ABC transporter permease [Clostridiales bacterium]
MRDIFTVFSFTLRDNVRKKSFIIITTIVLVLILGACALPSLLQGGSESEPGTTPGGQPGSGNVPVEKAYPCYVIDTDNTIPGVINALSAAFPHIEFKEGSSNQVDEYKKIVEESSAIIMEIAKGDILPELKFTVKSIFTSAPTNEIKEVIRQYLVSGAMTKAGVDEDLQKMAMSDIQYSTIPLKMDATGYTAGILITMIMFFAVYFYGYGVAMSVASEKTSRVMETLIVSAKPSRILLGKCIAMGALGLIQLSLFILAGVLGYNLLIPENFTISGMPIEFPSFSVSTALLLLVYFLLGYSLYAMINSVCGATVSRSEDLQTAMMPSVLISLTAFYAAYFATLMPDSGSAKKILTYIPFTSPFIMPSRLLNETVGAVDILISVLLLIAAIVLVSLLSMKFYQASVLHYGQRFKLKDFLKNR